MTAPFCGASSFLVFELSPVPAPVTFSERLMPRPCLADAEILLATEKAPENSCLRSQSGVSKKMAFRYTESAALGTSTPALHEAVMRLGYVMAPLCGASSFLASVFSANASFLSHFRPTPVMLTLLALQCNALCQVP